MRFTVNRNVLLKELIPLQEVAEKKGSIPVLSTILLECDTKGLSLAATDLDVYLRTSCEAAVHQPGSAVLSAKKLLEIIKLLAGEEIDFTSEPNDWVRITCDSSDFRLAGQAKEHFPQIPAPPASHTITVPAEILHGLIAKTAFAITTEESRYALQGSLFTVEGSTLRMVATDGHRLSLMESVLEETQAASIKVVIPRKTLTTLLKLSTVEKKGTPLPVGLSVGENHIFATIGNRQLASRMLAGQFPNYELVIPKNSDKRITLKTDQFARALKRAALMADERSHGVKLHFENNSLSISSETADAGSAREPITIDYRGEALSVGFNAHYVLEFLDCAGAEEISLELKDEQSPALLRPVGESSGHKYVAMPMRLL